MYVNSARKGGIRLDGEESREETSVKEEDEEQTKQLEKYIEEEKQEKTEAQKKEKADDLWASFMADVEKPSRPTSTKTTTPSKSLSTLGVRPF